MCSLHIDSLVGRFVAWAGPADNSKDNGYINDVKEKQGPEITRSLSFTEHNIVTYCIRGNQSHFRLWDRKNKTAKERKTETKGRYVWHQCTQLPQDFSGTSPCCPLSNHTSLVTIPRLNFGQDYHNRHRLHRSNLTCSLVSHHWFVSVEQITKLSSPTIV